MPEERALRLALDTMFNLMYRSFTSQHRLAYEMMIEQTLRDHELTYPETVVEYKTRLDLYKLGEV